MKIMTCPLNGPRNISEFTCFGEVTEMPDPASCSDGEWADHVFLQNNTAGVVREWWYHVATAYWFIAERHTVTGEIVRTFATTEVFKDRVEFTAPPPESEPEGGS